MHKINAAFQEWRVWNKTSAEGGAYNLKYTKEYGINGLELTGTDWHEFKGTAKINPAEMDSGNAPWFSVGFSVNCLKGTGADFRYSDFYLAKEEAYDITNTTTDATTLANGAQATFNAQVVNQIELPGYLDQTIEWRVMNKARTEDVEGFAITPGEDGTATVKVNGAAPGTYEVVAYSADYKMAKGVEITVVAEEVTKIIVDDSVAGKATLTALEVANTTAEKILAVIASYETDGAVKKVVDAKKAELTFEDGAAALVAPVEITANAGNEIRVFVWDEEGLRPITLANGVVATK